jgi:hypothetical protein
MTEATHAIAEGRGTQFDPELVDVFMSPPVLARIDKAMRRVNVPTKKNNGNRRRGGAQSAPDITFRWRPRERGPRSRDRLP